MASVSKIRSSERCPASVSMLSDSFTRLPQRESQAARHLHGSQRLNRIEQRARAGSNGGSWVAAQVQEEMRILHPLLAEPDVSNWDLAISRIDAVVRNEDHEILGEDVGEDVSVLENRTKRG